MKWFRTDLLGCYFILAIFFMDALFHYYIYGTFTIGQIVASLLFISAIAFALHLIVLFFANGTAHVIATLLLAGISLIYMSQTIYYAFFNTFYSVYSLGKGGAILQFWRDIVRVIGNEFAWLLLLSFPVFILAIFGRHYFLYNRGNLPTFGAILGVALLLHLGGIGLINVGEKGQHSAYELYYEQHLPFYATEKVGLLTSMRLDVQRTITNWSPPVADPPVIIEVDEEDEAEAALVGEAVEESPSEEPVAYNTLDLDFDQLIEDETNEEMIDLHTYFSNVEPTEKNEMTGKYENYNVILLTAEGFSPFAVDPDLTPTLHKLVHEGYYFPNFYTPIWEVSTSDGEYVALTSLVPKNGVWSMEHSAKNTLPFALGNQLSERGYTTKAYHNHTYTYYERHLSHPNLGYDYQGIGNGLDVERTWPASDLEMIENTMDEYIDAEPFHIYYLTISGHMQYSFEGNNMAAKNQHLVKDTPYSSQARAYLATQLELEHALTYMIERLEEAGIADRTLIALSSDHYPYGLDNETMDEFAGHEVEGNFERYENHFILYEPGAEGETIEKYGSSFDVLPTLSNLLGLNYDSRLMVGNDLFSDVPPLIPFLNRSFITDQGMYNSVTEEFIPHDRQNVDQAYIDQIKSHVEAHFYYSTKVLETDYYNQLGLE